MPTWLMRVAVGCATTIMSFLAMVLLFILALYLACGDCEPEYNSSASSYFILVPAAPLFLLASIILGAVVGCRMKPAHKIELDHHQSRRANTDSAQRPVGIDWRKSSRSVRRSAVVESRMGAVAWGP